MNTRNLKDEIIKLHSKGTKRVDIIFLLKCSGSTVDRYTKDGFAEKQRLFGQKWREASKQNLEKILQQKIYRFVRKGVGCKNRKASNKTSEITPQELLLKFGANPVCYITGEAIDLMKPKEYQFDHIIPHNKGGNNDIGNLGLAKTIANRAKTDMTPDELVEFCKKVLENLGGLSLTNDAQQKGVYSPAPDQ